MVVTPACRVSEISFAEEDRTWISNCQRRLDFLLPKIAQTTNMSTNVSYNPTPVKIALGDGKFIDTRPDPESKTHFVECDLCSQCLNMGPKGARKAIHSHRDKNSCREKALCNQQKAARGRIKVCILSNQLSVLC